MLTDAGRSSSGTRLWLGHGRGLPLQALLVWLIVVIAVPVTVVAGRAFLFGLRFIPAFLGLAIAEFAVYFLIRWRSDVCTSGRVGALTSGLAVVQGTMIIATSLTLGWYENGFFGSVSYVNPVLVDVLSPWIGNALAATQSYAIAASVAAWFALVVVAGLEYIVGRAATRPGRLLPAVLVSLVVLVACAAVPVRVFWQQQAMTTAPGEVWATGQAPPVVPYPDNPRLVPGLVDIREVVSAGYGGDIGYALDGAGTVWTWGSDILNPYGGAAQAVHRVVGLPKVASIAASSHGAAALDTAGTVWTWGLAQDCMLGEAGATDRAVPSQVQGLTGVTSVSASNGNMYAITASGVLVWGQHVPGVGYRTSADTCDVAQPTPIAVDDVADVIDQEGFVTYLKTDGSVWQQQSRTSLNQGLPPAQVAGSPRVVAISGSGYSCFALAADGTVWAWWFEPDTTPTPTSWLPGVASIDGSFALMKDGTVWYLGSADGSGGPNQVTGLHSIMGLSGTPPNNLLAIQG